MKQASCALRWICATAAAAAALQGCVVAAVGGAAVGSVVVLADRRSTGMQLVDAKTEHDINSALADRFARESVRIDVISYEQNVLLAGMVPSDQDRADAEAIARKAEGVRAVTNELAIGPMAGLNGVGDDIVLANKVRANLLGVPGLPAQVVQVDATLGSIYLFGKVSAQEADLAKQAASRVSGVKKVEALFEVLSPEDYAKYSQQPAPQQTSSQP